MTDNQKRFAREYVKCGNATEAYKKVYKVKNDMSAGTAGSRLLQNVNVREYIQELNKKQENKHTLDLEDCLRILTEIAEDPTSTKNERMKAIDMRMKTLGVYLQRMQIEDSSINIKIDTGDAHDS